MGDKTAIEWTSTHNADGTVTPGATWNPVVGCDRISPGCSRCYAKEIHDRRHKAVLSGKVMPLQYAEPFEVVRTRADRLDLPLRWRQPRKIFVNSMSDLFHEDVPDAFIDQVFAVMSLAPRHTFQVLTKRPARMHAYLTRHDVGLQWLVNGYRLSDKAADEWAYQENDAVRWTREGLPNVWIGCSVENQHFADERIPLLLRTPAEVRFISAEPLLGPVNLEPFLQYPPFHEHYKMTFGLSEWQGLSWIIAGGESGPDARPSDPAWFQSLRDQCVAANVPFFFKQWGEWAPGECAEHPATRTERTAKAIDGVWHFGALTPCESEDTHIDDQPDLYRFGKKRAGRSLDGRTWDQMPTART